MHRRAVLAVVTLALAGAALVRGEEVVPVIGHIEILVRDVFDDGGESPNFWAYQLANRLHLETRERVIRQELLFEEGDPLDREALEQTERNLRALPFLRDARVEATTRSDGRVRVRVETQDSWTTLPEVRLAKVGNAWTGGFGFTERNLLGRGKALRIFRESGLDRDETFALYQDPRLLGTRFALGSLYAQASDGHRSVLDLRRPFFSLETAWSLRGRYEDFEQLDPLYEDGERVAELRHLGKLGEIEVGRAVRRTGESALRVHAGYRFTDDDVAVEKRRFGVLQFGITSVSHRFLKLTHLNRFERPEDINLGNEASLFVGWSTPALGGGSAPASFLALSERVGLRLDEQGFVLTSLSFHARRRDGALENGLARARVDLVQKLSVRKVVLAKAELLYGRSLDPELQLRLGAESGLRGYPVRQFNGDRSLLVSAEGRWFLADDVARLLSIGAAAFVDSGFVWPEGQPMTLASLRSDVGVSLLLGGNRVSASRPGVRVDLAYALDPVPGHGRWLLSAGSRLQF